MTFLKEKLDVGKNLYDTNGGDTKIPSGIPTLIFPKTVGFNRHTLYIYNPNSFDIKLLKSNSKTGRGLTIKAFSSITFEYHLIAEVPVFEGDILHHSDYIGHCEWSEDVYIYHTGGTGADLEAMEVY